MSKPLLAQPIRDAREGVMADHTHKCAECGTVYTCLEFTKEECLRHGVFNAVKVNRGGPFCMFCLNLEMARRLAENRGWKLIYWIRKGRKK